MSLRCIVDGIPEPLVHWTKNTERIESNSGIDLMDGGRILRVEESAESDIGIYVCRAENQYGRAEKSFFVRILTRPTLKEEQQITEVQVLIIAHFFDEIFPFNPSGNRKQVDHTRLSSIRRFFAR